MKDSEKINITDNNIDNLDTENTLNETTEMAEMKSKTDTAVKENYEYEEFGQYREQDLGTDPYIPTAS